MAGQEGELSKQTDPYIAGERRTAKRKNKEEQRQNMKKGPLNGWTYRDRKAGKQQQKRWLNREEEYDHIMIQTLATLTAATMVTS